MSTLSTSRILQDEYNRIPYPSFPFTQTHPLHLFTIAKLFGLNPQPIATSRILELGCASGGNILPMAYHFPQAKLVGIDLAEKQIEQGMHHIKNLNLANLSLRHQSILDFEAQEGKFDYIICHGVYSWVDEKVRDKILQICQQNLSENGIAYISYNTFPGWNMINSVRDLMLWHTQNITDPKPRAQQARSVLKFIANGLPEDKSPHANVLRNEINLLSSQPDNYLLHEHLSHYNQPIYFYQFMEQASRHQLSYLADALLANMFSENLPPSFAKELSKINNIIAMGQYMDFIRNQRFRCTLLCHQSQKINRTLKTNDIESFYLKLTAKTHDPHFQESDIQSGKALSFTQGNLSLKVTHPLSQLALLILQTQTKPIHYQELCQKIAAKKSLDESTVKQHLNDELNLMRAVLGGFIHISYYPGNYVTELDDKPLACPLARYQAQKQNYVTNRCHQVIHLNPLTKVILPYLDGAHRLEDLIHIIEKQVQQGQLALIDSNKQPLTKKEEMSQQIQNNCKSALMYLAKQALLITASE